MHIRLLTALAAALLLFAACGDGDPTATDSPSPSPAPSTPPASASVTPVPSETTTPESEREKPKAFIKRWVQVSTEMKNTGDSTEYRQMSEGCTPCQNLADQIDGFYAAGGYVKTDGWSIKFIDTGTKGPVREFLLAVTSAPTEYKASADAKLTELSGGSFEQFIRIQHGGGGWRVVTYGEYVQ